MKIHQSNQEKQLQICRLATSSLGGARSLFFDRGPNTTNYDQKRRRTLKTDEHRLRTGRNRRHLTVSRLCDTDLEKKKVRRSVNALCSFSTSLLSTNLIFLHYSMYA